MLIAGEVWGKSRQRVEDLLDLGDEDNAATAGPPRGAPPPFSMLPLAPGR